MPHSVYTLCGNYDEEYSEEQRKTKDEMRIERKNRRVPPIKLIMRSRTIPQVMSFCAQYPVLVQDRGAVAGVEFARPVSSEWCQQLWPEATTRHLYGSLSAAKRSCSGLCVYLGYLVPWPWCKSVCLGMGLRASTLCVVSSSQGFR